MFDFTDPLSELKGKEIKRAALTESVDYISNTRGALNDLIYPELIKMVPRKLNSLKLIYLERYHHSKIQLVMLLTLKKMSQC